MVEPGQLAVVERRGDAEVDRAVAAVGVAVLLERGDHVAHRAQVRLVGGARAILDLLEPKRRRILVEGLDPGVGVSAQRDAGLLRLEDRPVVDVGEVHHAVHREPGEVAQGAAQHVDGGEGAEVADVAAGVDRQAAGTSGPRRRGTGRSPLRSRSACCRGASSWWRRDARTGGRKQHSSAPAPWSSAPGTSAFTLAKASRERTARRDRPPWPRLAGRTSRTRACGMGR